MRWICLRPAEWPPTDERGVHEWQVHAPHLFVDLGRPPRLTLRRFL
jgi:hypothetical protein